MSVRKALTFAFLDRYASLGVGIGATMILARLLTPADVAVFSIAAVLLEIWARDHENNFLAVGGDLRVRNRSNFREIV